MHHRLVTNSATPVFRYHPDPLGTGSAVENGAECRICGVARGILYDGPIYGRQADALCLACIRSGEAARALAVGDDLATFTDVGMGVPDDVPESVVDEVAHRTPGFSGWQQEHWLYHCGDAAAYIGRAGYERLRRFSDALEMAMHENDEFGWVPERSAAYVAALHEDGDATAYLFRCLHCGVTLAYTDMS